MPLVAPWNRKKRAAREKIGHEAPGTVLRGPPIAVTCECGEKRDLRYGEEWTCESCGRRWDTNQIPVEQYEAIRRTQLRFRVLPVLYGLGVLALAMFFTLTGNIFSVFILLPLGCDALVLLRQALPPQALPQGDRGAPEVGAPPRVGLVAGAG